MKDRKGEMLNLRTTKRLKDWLQRLVSKEKTTMGKWVQKKVVLAIWGDIETTAAEKAARQAAKENGIPEKIADKLDTLDEALLLIPPDKHIEFIKNANKLYSVYLKNEMQETGFKGLGAELEQINIV